MMSLQEVVDPRLRGDDRVWPGSASTEGGKNPDILTV